MAQQIPASGLPVGTVLTYNAHIDQSFLSYVRTGIGTPDALFQQIAAILNNSWGLQVTHSDYGALTTVVSGAATPISMQVQMLGPETYGKPDDIRSIIDGAIINALGSNYITDSNISDWTIPKSAGGSGDTVATGAMPASTNPFSQLLGTLGIDSSGVSNAIGSALNLNLSTKLIFGVIAIVIVAAVLIAIEPTAPGRAAAAFARRR